MTVHPTINFNHNTRRLLETACALQVIFRYYLVICTPNYKAEITVVKAEDKRPAQRVYKQSLTSFRYWWSFPSCTNMRRIPSQALQRMFSCSRFNQWDEKWLTGNEDSLANTSRTTLIASRWGCSYSIQDINLVLMSLSIGRPTNTSFHPTKLTIASICLPFNCLTNSPFAP